MMSRFDRRDAFLLAISLRLFGSGIASLDDESGLIWWLPPAIDSSAWCLAGALALYEALRRSPEHEWSWWVLTIPPLARVAAILMAAPREAWNDTIGTLVTNLALIGFIFLSAGVPSKTNSPTTPPGGITKIQGG